MKQFSEKNLTGEIFTEKDLDDCDGILLDKIGVAIVNKNPRISRRLHANLPHPGPAGQRRIKSAQTTQIHTDQSLTAFHQRMSCSRFE